MKCTDCSLHRSSRCNNLSGNGPTPCDIMLVGEAPGAQEEERNAPFVGAAGWLLDNEFLVDVGLKRTPAGSEVRVTNACRCRPPENRDPNQVEINACRKHLLAEIKEVQPKLIVALGAIALKSLLGLEGIQKYRGHFFNSQEFPGLVIATNHPAACFRSWEVVPLIKADLRKALGVFRGELSFADAGTYVACDTLEKVRQLTACLCEAEHFSFDLETTGLRFSEDKILCFSFARKPGEGFVIPVAQQFQTPLWQDAEKAEVANCLKTIFASAALKVAQNGVFDLLFCWANGLAVHNYNFDTMYAHHLLDENLPHSLDAMISFMTTMPLCSHVLGQEWSAAKKLYKKCKRKNQKGIPAEIVEQVLRCGENYALLPNETLWQYAAQDADATIQVYPILNKQLSEQGLLSLLHEITMPMAHFAARLQWNGVSVDVHTLKELHKVKDAEAAVRSTEINLQLTQDLRGAAVELNTRSNKQMKEILVEKCNWPVVKRTDTGAPSFDEDALTEYAEKQLRPVAKMILGLRGVQKEISTYLAGSDGKSGMLKHVHKDGKVHPSFKLTGARTGRLSTVDPALHNVPKEPLNLRGCFIPRDGWWWVEADHSQLELRILAVLSQDPQLTLWFREGADVHRMVAAEIYNKDADSITEKERSNAKTVNFGIIYGQGPKSLGDAIGVSFEQAEIFMATYFARLPGVKKFFDSLHSQMYQTGEVRNVFGRVRHLYGARFYWKLAQLGNVLPDVDLLQKRKELERQAVNSPIQGAGSDLLNKACIRIAPRLEGFETTYNHHHHDALHLHMPPKELLAVGSIVKEEMERPCPELGGQIFPIVFKVGTHWGDENEEATQWLMDQLS